MRRNVTVYYAKELNASGELVALHTMDHPFSETTQFVPLTATEYEVLLTALVAEEDSA